MSCRRSMLIGGKEISTEESEYFPLTTSKKTDFAQYLDELSFIIMHLDF